MKRFLLAVAAGLLAANPLQARTLVDEQLWLNATVIGVAPGGDLAYFLEAQPRWSDGADRLGQLLLRGAVGVRASDAVTVYGGYMRVVQGVRTNRDENRFFAQLSWSLGELAGGALSSRTRLEHRRLVGARDTGWRVRQLARWVRPLGAPARTRALLSLEPFVAFNDTDWTVRAGFDQLRSFVGVEVPLGGRSTLEVGYLNQLINDPARRRRMNHAASLALFIRP